jgi:hypothetical protein
MGNQPFVMKCSPPIVCGGGGVGGLFADRLTAGHKGLFPEAWLALRTMPMFSFCRSERQAIRM